MEGGEKKATNLISEYNLIFLSSISSEISIIQSVAASAEMLLRAHKKEAV